MPHGGTKRQETEPSCSSPHSGSNAISDERSPVPSAVASKRPENTYEKRPRHKTREDRYEPKTSRRQEKRHGQNHVKSSSKRKRAKKTGGGVAYDHDPEAASANRLTVWPLFLEYTRLNTVVNTRSY